MTKSYKQDGIKSKYAFYNCKYAGYNLLVCASGKKHNKKKYGYSNYTRSIVF